MKKHIFRLAIQLLACVVLALISYLLKPIRPLHLICVWGIFPLAGAYSAFVLVKKDINPYLTWLLPPIGLTLGSYIATMGYLPDGGVMLLSAFVSLAGAAVGDTYLKFKSKRHK